MLNHTIVGCFIFCYLVFLQQVYEINAFCRALPSGGPLSSTALLRQHTPDGEKCMLRIHHPTQSDATATANTIARGILFLDSAASNAAVIQVIPNTVGSGTEGSAPLMEFFVGGDANAFKWMTISTMGNIKVLGASSTMTVTNDFTVNADTIFGDAKATDNMLVNSISTLMGVTNIQNTFHVKTQNGGTTMFTVTEDSGNVDVLGATAQMTVTNDFTVNADTIFGDAKATDNMLVNSISTLMGVTNIQNTFNVKNQDGNTVQFTVAENTGNTEISGTLDVTGATTLSSTLAVTGATTLSSTTRSVGNFDVNTNKFTVKSATGNTLVAGTLGVSGATTLSSTLGVTGATTLGSTLSVSGTTTLATVNSGTWQGTCVADNYVCSKDNWNAKVDTAGTGLSLTGTTLSVDASQTQITGVGTITTGTWSADAIVDNKIASANTWNNKQNALTAGQGLSLSGSTISVDASQTQITGVGTITTGTWSATSIADNKISSANTWNNKQNALTAGQGLSLSGTTLSVDASQTQITGVGTITTGTWRGTSIADNKISSANTWNNKQSAISVNYPLTMNGNTITCNNCDNRRRRLLSDEHEFTEPAEKRINMEPLPKAMSASQILSTLEVYTYEYRKEGNKTEEEFGEHINGRQFGISSHELKTKLPHILTDHGFHGPSLQVFMIQAIKEMQLEITKLKQKVKSLEGK